MKLSTRIKKAFPAVWVDRAGREFYSGRKIVFCLDCKEKISCTFLDDADAIHRRLIDRGYMFLPDESPVINQVEVVLHYTRFTYNRWRCS